MLEQGFTLVWVGWQFDVTGANNVKLYAPVLPGVTGKVRTEILVNQKTTTQALPYTAASVASGSLTVRDKADGAAVCDSERSMEAEWRRSDRVRGGIRARDGCTILSIRRKIRRWRGWAWRRFEITSRISNSAAR